MRRVRRVLNIKADEREFKVLENNLLGMRQELNRLPIILANDLSKAGVELLLCIR
jgi:hypothetical protein